MSAAANGHLDLEDVPFERRTKALRDALGWTQQELADELGMSVRQIKRWETGVMPSEESAEALAALAPRSWRVSRRTFWEPPDKRLELVAELRRDMERLERRVARLERERRRR